MIHATWYRLRGNAAGRRKAPWVRPFFCTGCQRQHGERVERVGVGPDLYCWRTYLKMIDRNRLQSVTNPPE